MAAQILDGKLISAEMRAEMKAQADAFCAETGVTPGLAVILVGEDPASTIYVRNKEIACEEVGLLSKTFRMPADTTQAELEAQILALNADETIHGILVQLPLPRHLNEEAALALIRPEKDVDGFHIMNAGLLVTGQEGIVACTPKGIMEMIHRTGVDLSGKEAVVIGRSNIVGKPVAMLLLHENCTVTMCHSRTKDLAAHTRNADVLVAAVGRANFVTADMIKPGAIVIDVGINRVEGKVVGDVDFAAAAEKASWITPVPGGVGRMTVTMLIANTLQAAAAQVKKRA